MKKILILQRIKTPDGTILTSHHRHDFQSHIDKNGERYFCDGGSEYIRTSVNDEPFIEMHVYNTDSHSIIREAFRWGTYGKNGDEPLKYILLKDMETEHINAILKTQTHISDEIKKIFIDELSFRKNDVVLFDTPFIKVKESYTQPYFYSERKGIDSVAFILFDREKNQYGLVKERKPPMDARVSERAVRNYISFDKDTKYAFLATAFGGSNDKISLEDYDKMGDAHRINHFRNIVISEVK